MADDDPFPYGILWIGDWALTKHSDTGEWWVYQRNVEPVDGHGWTTLFERQLGRRPADQDEIVAWLPPEVPDDIRRRFAAGLTYRSHA